MFLSPLGGCSGGGSTGEGTIDISRAKAASSSNPDTAKAVAARSKGGMHDAQKKKGRR